MPLLALGRGLRTLLLVATWLAVADASRRTVRGSRGTAAAQQELSRGTAAAQQEGGEAESFRCGLWRGLPQVFDALPGGGFRRRGAGDEVAELPKGRCSPLRSGDDALLQLGEEWPHLSADAEFQLRQVDAEASQRWGRRRSHHYSQNSQNSHNSHKLFAEEQPAAHSRLPLVPYPANVTTLGDGSHHKVHLTAHARVVLGDGIREHDPAVKALRSHLASLAGRNVHRAGGDEVMIQLTIDPSIGSGTDVEGYVLAVKDGQVGIIAPSSAGAFYAVQTLRQLSPYGSCPGVIIEDYPRFTWRGVHLDVSRHFFKASDVMKLLDVMSQLKLNRFHWHLTDDQGWRLPIPGYPRLTTLGASGTSTGAYTEAEIREVVAFAHDRHIQVLPEVDVPGHVTAAVAAYPELGNTDVPSFSAPEGPSKEWGVQQTTLSPKPSTLLFLDAVFAQVESLFPDSMMHVGGDEVQPDEWRMSATARHALKREHLQNYQQYFNIHCWEKLRGKNMSMVAWGEASLAGKFPQNGIVMVWDNIHMVADAVKSGRHAINADEWNYYFDKYQAMGNEPKAIGGLIELKRVYVNDPMPRDLEQWQQRLVLGAQAELWTEYMSTWDHVEYMAFPRTHAMAERVWTPRSQLRNFDEFTGRLAERLKDLDRQGVSYKKL